MFGCFKMKRSVIAVLCGALIAVSVLFAALNTLKGNAEKTDRVFVPIIMYHSIIDNETAEGEFRINVNTVENDLKYLKTHGYTAVFVEQLADYVINNAPLPERPVVITADDGFYNNLYYLLPLLEKYDMKATISVVGYYSEVLAHNDPHVPKYSYLTWDDIKLLLDSGRVELGNHTYNLHSLSERKGCGKLSYETEEEYRKLLYEDIGLNQTLLKVNTGTAPGVFAYPFGAISKESIPVIKDMGFYGILTCFEKPNYITHDIECLYCLNRYNRPAGMSTYDFMVKCLKEN